MNFYGKRPDDYVKPVLNTGDTMTKKSQQKETDINVIIKKYDRTGILAHMSQHEPVYMDVEAIDFQTAMNTVIAAENAFNDLPSALRKRFRNNPKEFLDYVQNAPRDELVELGLAPMPEIVQPTAEDVSAPEKVQEKPSS